MHYVRQGRLLCPLSESCCPVAVWPNNICKKNMGFPFMVNRRSIDDIDAWFSKVIQVFFWRFDAWLVHTPHQLSRWCPATIISQMSCCSTLTLSWSRGEKRCRTSLGPCWWRAARPIRRRSVSHHVTASPIAIYFTIGQMKRLILTICSLMCFSLSFFLSTAPAHTLFSPSLPWLQTLGISRDKILKIICYSGSRFRTQLMGGIVWTGNLIHQLHLLFTVVN